MRNCLCRRNAGAMPCAWCQQVTCTHCHHSDRHLTACPETRRRETRKP
jgi:hypothetical protein